MWGDSTPTGANKDGGFVYSEANQASVLTRYLALMFVNGIENVDSEDVYLVDMEGNVSSPQVYNTSVMVTAVEEPQYLVEFKQSRNKNGFEYVLVTKGKIVRGKYRYHGMSENELNV